MKNKIDILLATYNGEKHIKQLLDSIISQIDNTMYLKILIRDDRSSDNTPNIIKKYKEEYPQIIEQIIDQHGNIGPMKNFEELTKHSTADYILFADQDDIWIKGKISHYIKTLLSMEKEYTNKIPLLVFSDMYIVDNNINIICPSYYKYCKKKPRKIKFKDLILQNNMLGCVQGFNRALLKKAFPLDKEVIMHDWWIGIVASAFGKIQYIDKKYIYYRQHSGNVVGARGPGLSTYKKMLPWANKESYIKHFNAIFQQAKHIQEKYPDELKKENEKILQRFLSIQNKKLFKRLYIIMKNRFFRNNIHETLEVIFRYCP